jgi:hypothetical protein
MLWSRSPSCATSNLLSGVERSPVAIALVMLAAFFVLGSASAQAQRQRVDLGCRPTEQALTFLCTISAADPAGAPVDGAQITLTADMPSMPMAHNVSPVKAQPVSGQPGKYEGRLRLGMLGEWAVKIRFEAPQQDVVVRKLMFEKDKVSSNAAH